MFSPCSSPKVSLLPQMCLPSVFSGEAADTRGPSACPPHHLCRGKDQRWADLWAAGGEGSGAPAPQCPSRPLAAPFLRESPRQCPAPLGTRSAPARASAPHTGTFRRQWETARSVSSGPFFQALRATFSTAICSLSPLGQCCFFKPAILPPLSPSRPPPTPPSPAPSLSPHRSLSPAL